MTRCHVVAMVLLLCLLDWTEAIDFHADHSIRGWTREAVVDFLVRYDLDAVELAQTEEAGIFDAYADAIFAGSYYRHVEIQHADVSTGA